MTPRRAPAKKPAKPKRASTAVATKGVSWDGFAPTTTAWGSGLPGRLISKIDYAAATNNGMQSSVVTSALCWMMRVFPEAPVVVQKNIEDRWENQAGHDLAKLIKRPNPYYGGRVLWMATVMDFCFGEAYWIKVRNGNGNVVELYWAPRWMMTPKANAVTGALDHYEYNPGGGATPKDLDLGDVVHFRFGIDPANLLRGFSPLAAVMREVYTDDQAATFTAAILRNLGIIGVIITPEGPGMTTEQAKKFKDDMKGAFTGDQRAEAMVFSAPMKAQLLQYNLQGFDVGPIRDISEERVCAALAIPAAVIGFGTGLQQTKVGATMREMVKLAWQGGIEPNQAIMADELDRSLLPEFHANLSMFRTHFDTSEVEALSETPQEKTTRVLSLVEGNVIKVTQAQRELGYPVDESQDKYARELTAATRPAMPLNRVAAALGDGAGENGNNGNGDTPPGDDNG